MPSERYATCLHVQKLRCPPARFLSNFITRFRYAVLHDIGVLPRLVIKIPKNAHRTETERTEEKLRGKIFFPNFTNHPIPAFAAQFPDQFFDKAPPDMMTAKTGMNSEIEKTDSISG